MTIMVDKTTVPPMIDHRCDAGPDDFFCETCCSWHPKEYRSDEPFYFAGREIICCQFGYNSMAERSPEVNNGVTKIPAGQSSGGVKRRRGRPRKEVAINKVLDSGKTPAELAEELGMSVMTIYRRKNSAQGQLFPDLPKEGK